MPDPQSSSLPKGREWLRAAMLFGIAATTSVFQPAVLVGVPFILFAGVKGIRNVTMMVAVTLAMLIVVSGARDGFWYVERAWTVMLAGWFLGLSMWRPAWDLSAKTFGAVMGAAGSAALVMALRSGAWSALDWTVTDRVQGGIATVLDAAAVVRGGEAVSPAFVSAMYETAETQLAVFPALTALASMAALGVAWWLVTRFSKESRPVIGPMWDFRFNDHYVWIFIGGVLLLVTRWSEPLYRVGSNAVAFMGALYALRGAAVVVFMSGGFSWFGYAMTALGLLLMTPVVLGAAIVIGIGDTWLNVRDRMREMSA